MNYNFQSYTKPEKPSLNGGLYSGEKFKGPWGNYPVIPEATQMIHNTLRSANPPPNAILQYGNYIRPGNNEHPIPTKHNIDETLNIQCVGSMKQKPSFASHDPNPHEFYQSW